MEGAKCSERSEAARMLDREQRAPGSVTRNEAARKGECACGIKMPVSPGPSPQRKEAGEQGRLTWFRDACDAPGSAGRTFAVPCARDRCACSCCWYNCAPCTRCKPA